MLVSRSIGRALGRDTSRLYAQLPKACLTQSSQIFGPSRTVPVPQTRRPTLHLTSFRSYATAKRSTPKRASTGSSPSKARSTKKTATKTKKQSPAKPKKAARKKKEPTEAKTKATKVNELRQKALLDGPKPLPTNPWQIYVADNVKKGGAAPQQLRDATTNYRSLSAAQREHLDNVAKQNRQKNERSKQEWIETHTPDEVRVANNARRQLNKIRKEPLPDGRVRPYLSHHLSTLDDPRAPARSVGSAYMVFATERRSDYKHLSILEQAAIMGREWKSLSSSEAKKYHDQYNEAAAKYREEYNRVFTKSPGGGPKGKPKKATAA